jgi:E3 ubiquitin-protein ligase TRIP12
LDEDGENIHLIEETDVDDDEEDDEDEDEDDDYNEEDEDDDDDEDDIESAMNAFLSSAARRAGSSAGYESSLSSKHFFTGLYGSSGSTTNSTLSGITSGGVYPKLELLINDHVLPTNMTIYQAIKQFGSSGTPVASTDQSMLTENDAENTSLINNAIWSKVHLIHYRIAQSCNTSAASTAAAVAATTEVSSKASTSKETDTKRSTRNSITKQQTSSTSSTLPIVTKKQQGSTKNDNDSSLDVVTDSNLNSITNTTGGLDVSLTNFLNKLTSSKSKLEENINDRSIDSILLLRLLSSVNREWLLMYKDVLSLESIFTFTNTNNDLATQSSAFLTGMNEFVNTKLTAKANRQLQDPLVVMTGKIHELIFKGKKLIILK